MKLLDLGIKIGKNWYSVGNTEYDIFTLRLKDFICMVNFFLGCVPNCYGFGKPLHLDPLRVVD